MGISPIEVNEKLASASPHPLLIHGFQVGENRENGIGDSAGLLSRSQRIM
jgi:hypothetical protein